MLELLHIENIAIIELCDIMFQKGFNVLSGETGAGKSIVIDSLSAVLGERTSRDLIRSGAQKAYVSAIFSNIPYDLCHDLDIYPDDQMNFMLERELLADGRNVCKVNGRIVTVSQLRIIGNRLLNIHGQHDGQQLLDESQHLQYLDNYGGLKEDLENYRFFYQEYVDIKHQIDALRMDESEKERRIDTLKYQIKELSAANLQAGEEDTLQNRKSVMKNGEKFISLLSECDFLLNGDDNADGVLSALKQASKSLDNLGGINDDMANLSKRLNDAFYEIYDIANTVNSEKNHFDFSQADIDEIEGRLDLIYRLKKKYGPSVEDMIVYLEKCQQELDNIEYSEDKIIELERKLTDVKNKATEAAVLLSKKRKTAAASLKEQIQNELSELDMPKVRFEVEFENCELSQDGMDMVRFLMSANLGEDLKPINKIASGGELARIMLALKNVLSEQDHVNTLVFDEIDTGVSGRAAQKVAEKMSRLSGTKQVLCVTHLPQIAAMADDHYLVEKEERDGRTFTNVKLLSFDERKHEIARLTGGTHISDVILQGAEELLNEAMNFKH